LIEKLQREQEIKNKIEKKIKEIKGADWDTVFKQKYEARIKAKEREFTIQRDKANEARALRARKLGKKSDEIRKEFENLFKERISEKTKETFKKLYELPAELSQTAVYTDENIANAIEKAESLKVLLKEIVENIERPAKKELEAARERTLKSYKKQLKTLEQERKGKEKELEELNKAEAEINNKAREKINDITAGIKTLKYDDIVLKLEDKGVKAVLESEKIDAEKMKTNNDEIVKWFESSEILTKVGKEVKDGLITLLRGNLNLTLNKIADTEQINSIVERDIDEHIEETLRDMSLGQYLRYGLTAEFYAKIKLDKEVIETNVKKLNEKGVTAEELPLKILDSDEKVIDGFILLLEFGIASASEIRKYSSKETINNTIIEGLGRMNREKIKKAAQYLYEGNASDSDEMKIESALNRYAESIEKGKGEKGGKDYGYAYEAYKNSKEIEIFEKWDLADIITIMQSEVLSKAINIIMTQEEISKAAEKLNNIEAIKAYIKGSAAVGSLTKAGIRLDDKSLSELGYGKKETKEILKKYKSLLNPKGMELLGVKTLEELSLNKKEAKAKAEDRKVKLGQKTEEGLKEEAKKKLEEEAAKKNVQIKEYTEENINRAVEDLVKEYGGSVKEYQSMAEIIRELKEKKGLSEKLINSLTLSQILGKEGEIIRIYVNVYERLNDSEKEEGSKKENIEALRIYVKEKVKIEDLLKGNKIDKEKFSLLGFSKEEIRNISQNYKEAKKDGKTNEELLISGLVKAKEKVTKKKVAEYAEKIANKYMNKKERYADIASLPSDEYRMLVLKELFDNKAAQNIENNLKKALEVSDKGFVAGLSLHVLEDNTFIDELIKAIKEGNEFYRQKGMSSEINIVYIDKNKEFADIDAKIKKIKEIHENKKIAQSAASETAAVTRQAAQSPVAVVGEGLKDTVVRSIEGVEISVPKACLAAAADAVGRPITQAIIAKVLPFGRAEIADISDAEDLLAAGTKDDIVLPMKTLNQVGLTASAVSVEELENIKFKGTMIAYMNNGQDAVGHAVAVKSITNGKVV
jgi:hypothetical protein